MSVRVTFEYDARDHYEAARAVTRSTSARDLSGVMAAALGLLVWRLTPRRMRPHGLLAR